MNTDTEPNQPVVESPDVARQRVKRRLLRERLTNCVEERALATIELETISKATRGARIRSACSILMIITEAMLTLSLLSEFTRDYPADNATAPMQLLILIGLLLAHPRVGAPSYDRDREWRVNHLRDRINGLVSWQCELENYAELERIPYKDITLRQPDAKK